MIARTVIAILLCAVSLIAQNNLSSVLRADALKLEDLASAVHRMDDTAEFADIAAHGVPFSKTNRSSRIAHSQAWLNLQLAIIMPTILADQSRSVQQMGVRATKADLPAPKKPYTLQDVTELRNRLLDIARRIEQ
jgi:hypothetical protein